MKSFAISAALLAASATGALAADFYSPPPLQSGIYGESSAFNWTGFYAGLHGGFGGDRFDYPYFIDDGVFGTPNDITGQFDLTSSGFFAGAQIGANWELRPHVVIGVEADIAWSDIKGELGFELDPIGGFPGLDVEVGSKVNWFGTIRGRLGILPTERLMIYGTAGAAYGEIESYANVSGAIDFDTSTSNTAWGWTAGGGFEYAVTDHVTLKTEYLYVDLSSQELLNFGGGAATLDAEAHFHTIKAGLNILYN